MVTEETIAKPKDQLTDELRSLLKHEGFSQIGITDAGGRADWSVRLRAFVGAGWHGQMSWLARRSHWRSNPKAMWHSAQSAVLVGLNYGPQVDPLAHLGVRSHGVISVYAQGADYHDVIKKRLKRAARLFSQSHTVGVKVFVDTAPVMEKPLAARAGLGWQGKHTNLVSSEFGSWLFLGAILTTAKLTPDQPHRDQCGSCRACLDICPTKAFPAPYQLDARKCISYLTIEHDGPIPRSLRPAIGNRIYGCDDCLAVCPWNKFAQTAKEAAFFPRPVAHLPALADLITLDDKAFREVFRGSPIKRIGRDRFIRNVLIAIGNSGTSALLDPTLEKLRDPAAIVRGAAVWAASRLMPAREFAQLKAAQLPGETDPAVRQEWADAQKSS